MEDRNYVAYVRDVEFVGPAEPSTSKKRGIVYYVDVFDGDEELTWPTAAGWVFERGGPSQLLLTRDQPSFAIAYVDRTKVFRWGQPRLTALEHDKSSEAKLYQVGTFDTKTLERITGDEPHIPRFVDHKYFCDLIEPLILATEARAWAKASSRSSYFNSLFGRERLKSETLRLVIPTKTIDFDLM